MLSLGLPLIAGGLRAIRQLARDPFQLPSRRPCVHNDALGWCEVSRCCWIPRGKQAAASTSPSPVLDRAVGEPQVRDADSSLQAHAAPRARAIIRVPAAMTTTPATRAAYCGLGESRSTVIAALTTAMAPRSITPVARRIMMKPKQHRLQRTPKRRPCCQALRASSDDPQAGAFRQCPSWRAFHAVS
jgi:hypothetical protein